MGRGFLGKCSSLAGARVLGMREEEFQVLPGIALQVERMFNLDISLHDLLQWGKGGGAGLYTRICRPGAMGDSSPTPA